MIMKGTNMFGKWFLPFTAAVMAAAYVAPAMGEELEEVLVTAQKRQENLQDIGLSVTALDAEGLSRAGIDDLSRIELVTPGVSYGYIGSDAKVAIRGANSNNTFADNSSVVGFFVDGVYRPRASQQSQAFFDVERVEVLKGPQGTLYGRNTFAGAINLYTNRPDLEKMSGNIDVSSARYEKVRTEGAVNVPLGERFAMRFAGMSETSDGWIENAGPGGDLGEDDDVNYRVSALWVPTDDIEVLVRFTAISEEGTTPGIFAAEGHCRPVDGNGLTDAFGQFVDCQNPAQGSAGVDSDFDEPWQVNYDVPNTRDNSEENLTLDVNWSPRFSPIPINVRYIGSYTDFDSEFDFDGDFSGNLGYAYYWDEGTESYTNELQVSSNDDESRFKWTTGIYYSVDEIGFGFSQLRTSSVGPRTRMAADQAQPQPNILTILDGTTLVDAFGGGIFSAFASFQEIETTTLGLYFQGVFSVTDAVRLIGGVRYNDEEKDTVSFTSAPPADSEGNPLSGSSPREDLRLGLGGSRPRDVYTYTPNPATSADRSFDDITWRAGVEFDANEDILLYFNVATGFLSGGVNANGTPFESQESLAYEVGVKSRWLENRLQLNAAVYFNEFSELTTQQLVETQPGVFQTFTVNGGEVDTLGLEIEGLWFPTDQLFLSAGLSFIDNEFGEFGVNNPFQLINGVETTPNFIDLDGLTPPWSPDFTASLSAGFDIGLGQNGKVTPYVQFYYSDSYNTDDVVTYSTQVQDSYTKTDLRLIWTSLNEQWEVEAFVENIEDEAVLARTNVGGEDLVQTSYLYPRNYGMMLKFRF